MEDENEELEEGTTYSVDIPNALGYEWITVEEFKTKAEALDFANRRFGADENGMVCLLSEY